MGWKIAAAFLALLTISGLGELQYILTSPDYASTRGQMALMGSVMVFLFALATYKAWKEGTKNRKERYKRR